MGEHRKKLVERIRDVGTRYGKWDVFSDLALITSVVFSNRFDKTHYDEREKLYFDTIKKYDKDALDKLAGMLGDLIFEIDEEEKAGRFTDVLGEIFEHDLNLRDEWKGQFFTPSHVAEIMAMMVDAKPGPCGFTTLNEPTCGSGRMVFGAYNAYRKLHKDDDPRERILVYADDIDERCVWMSYAQFAIYGIPAVVRRADSLRMKVYDVWYTPAYILGGWEEKARMENALETLHDLMCGGKEDKHAE